MLEIITHCWAGDAPQYAGMLHYHLGAISDAPEVRATVVCAREGVDPATDAVLERWLVGLGGLRLQAIRLDLGQLFRRSIGRNLAAKATAADVVWFADVDYVLGSPKAAREILAAMNPETQLTFAPAVHICENHKAGDAEWSRAIEAQRWGYPKLSPEPAKYLRRRERRAIGGNMFLGGNHARRGYLDGSRRWSRPVDASKGFARCKCDPAFRKWLGHGAGEKMAAEPLLYRIRHTVNGRNLGHASCDGSA